MKKFIAVGLFPVIAIIGSLIVFEATRAQTWPEKRSNIALLRVELPQSFYEAERVALVSDFLSALHLTDKFDIVSRESMTDIIQELKFQASDLANQDEVVELGNMLGVEFFMTLNVRPVQGIYQVTAKMINVEKAQVERLVVKRCENRFDYLPAIFNEVAYDLAGIQDKKGTLQINTTPPAAEVFLLGISKGYSPMSLQLAPGPYLVSLKKSGYKERRKTFYISSDHESEWIVNMQKKQRFRLGDYIGGKSFWRQ